MTLVIGTDEAGYGPNLGPLVVGATAWRIDAEPDAAEARLDAAVSAVAGGLWGDSKKIFRAGAGLDALERGVFVAMAMASHNQPPTSWRLLMTLLVATIDSETPESIELDNLMIPQQTHLPSCRERSIAITESLASSGVCLEAMRARVVPPGTFNAMLDTGLNKSDILSQITLDLAASLAALAPPGEPCLVWCDRHGGRRRYAAIVARAFDLSLVQPLEETATCSAYVLPAGGRIEFAVGGEARIPVALASMTAKYLRELSMTAFNAFWCERAAGLLPTAGYPVDALRWRREAAAAIEESGLGIEAIWRRA